MELDVANWQRQVQYGDNHQELGLSAHLFEATATAFSAILKIIADEPGQYEDGSMFYTTLRDEFQKFYMWNEGFSTSSGELDAILLCSKNMRATVLGLMVQWAKVVCRIPKVLPDYSWSGALPQLIELEDLADKISQVAEAAAKDINALYAIRNIDNESDYDSDSDSGSDSSSFMTVGEFEDIAEDLKVYGESLMDLTPSLENPASDSAAMEESNVIQKDGFLNVTEPARPFALIIKDRFPSLDSDLVKKLGEANWQRRERLSRKLAHNQTISMVSSSDSDTVSAVGTAVNVRQHQDDLDGPPRASIVRSSMSFASNHQSVTTSSNFSEPSIFDRNSAHISLYHQRRSIAESVTSFATSLADGVDDGQRRLPILPSDHDFDSSFQCKICGDILTSISNRADWKRHVYADLEPYICLFTDCALGLYTFHSQREWMAHEFTSHRTETQWRCNLCADKFLVQEQLRAHIERTHELEFISSQVTEVISASKRIEPKGGGTEICPFCLVAPAQTQRAFARHVGRHLQEISLAALPLLGTSANSNSDDDNDDNDQDDESNVELDSVQSNDSHETLKDYGPGKASIKELDIPSTAQISPAITLALHSVKEHEDKEEFENTSQCDSNTIELDSSLVRRASAEHISRSVMKDPTRAEDNQGDAEESNRRHETGLQGLEISPPTRTGSIHVALPTHRDAIDVSLAPKQPIHTGSASFVPEVAVQKLKERLVERRSVIKELLDSQSGYLTEMNVVEEIYKGTSEACPRLNSGDIKTLFRNTHQIVSFSTMLLDQLKAASASISIPPHHQFERAFNEPDPRSKGVTAQNHDESSDLEKDKNTSIGAVFERNLAQMHSIFLEYLAKEDQAISLLETLKLDATVQIWLDECNYVSQDLTTVNKLGPDGLLDQPRHQLHRYQSIIRRLNELTPKDHPDYPALESVQERIGGMIKYIDDYKKRLNTVRHVVAHKRKESNLGSLAKALGRREKTQPSSLPLDDQEYLELCQKFRDKYLQLQVVLQDLEFYTRQINTHINNFLLYLSSVELIMRVSPSPYPELEAKWARFNMSMRSFGTINLQEHTSMVRKRVIEPFEKVMEEYGYPDLLMKRRNELQPDHEKWLLKWRDRKKADKTLTEAAEQYKALDETLKIELPKLFELTERIGILCLCEFVHIQANWLKVWQERLKTVIDACQLPSSVDDIIDEFHRNHKYPRLKIQELGITDIAMLERYDKTDSRSNLLAQDKAPPRFSSSHANLDNPPSEAILELGSTLSNALAPDSLRTSEDINVKTSILRPKDYGFYSAYPAGLTSTEEVAAEKSKGRDSFKILYMAASLFEFNLSATMSEAGYPYLTYDAGEIFDVIGEKGELWLAKNQDDPSQRVGWIWSKHFARLAAD